MYHCKIKFYNVSTRIRVLWSDPDPVLSIRFKIPLRSNDALDIYTNQEIKKQTKKHLNSQGEEVNATPLLKSLPFISHYLILQFWQFSLHQAPLTTETEIFVSDPSLRKWKKEGALFAMHRIALVDYFYLIIGWCYLPCNHRSRYTWVVEEMWIYSNRLRSTRCREFFLLKLCRPACFFTLI